MSNLLIKLNIIYKLTSDDPSYPEYYQFSGGIQIDQPPEKKFIRTGKNPQKVKLLQGDILHIAQILVADEHKYVSFEVYSCSHRP